MDYAKEVEEFKKLFPIAEIVRKWFRAQSEDPARRFYVFYKPSAGPEAGAMGIFSEGEIPPGFILVSHLMDSAFVSPAYTAAQVERALWDLWKTLPVLPRLEKNENKDRHSIQVGRSELAAILASLRYWQEKGMPETVSFSGHPLWDVATDGGSFRALTTPEIDSLCERLNTSSHGSVRKARKGAAL